MQAAINMCRRIKELSTGKMWMVTMNRPDVKELIVHLNTEGQLRFGVLSSGVVLPNYSRVSQDLFGKDNIPIQLYDTGAFYESFRVVAVTEHGLSIFANDTQFYDVPLTDTYSIDVIGLTEESKAILMENIIPHFVIYIIDYVLQDNK
jgi:hypothetical protein